MSREQSTEIDIDNFADVEWEGLMLGNILDGETDRQSRILASLERDDFTAHRHQILFDTMRDMSEKGVEISRHQTAVWMADHGKLKDFGSISGKAGGISALLEYSELRITDIDGGIRVLRGKTIDREAWRLSVLIQEQCATGYTKATDEITAVQERLTGLAKGLTATNEHQGLLDGLSLDSFFRKPEGQIPTPWPELSRNTNGGIRRGKLWIIGARPNVGKTLAGFQIALHAAERGARVDFFSLEMGKEDMLRRMFADIGSVNHDMLVRGELDADARRRVQNVCQRVKDWKLEIHDKTSELREIMGILGRGKRDLVVIDYLGLIETSGRFENRNQEISYLSRRIKAYAHQSGTPVVLLVQLNRSNENEAREPVLSDIRDSGSLEQDADTVILMHEPSTMKRGGNAPQDQILMLIRKQRDGAKGTVVYLTKQGHFCRLVEPMREEERYAS